MNLVDSSGWLEYFADGSIRKGETVTYRGRIKNGVVVLNPPTTLPEGCEVEVALAEEQALPPTWAEVFKDITGKAEGLPPDMARNHDHYLHGAPKQ